MAWITLPSPGAVISVVISAATTGADSARIGNGSDLFAQAFFNGRQYGRQCIAGNAGSATNSSAWPRRAPRLSNLLRLLAETADSWPSTIRT